MEADIVRQAASDRVAGLVAWRRKLWIVAVATLAPLLAGCVFDTQELVLTTRQLEERTPYTSVPTTQAWVNAPGMRNVLERNLRTGLEQKISLTNDTPVPGDNLMMLRTQNSVSGFGRLRFESVISGFGGLPQPFTGLSSGDLMQGEDGIGPYFWAAQNLGGTTCILGMRRLNSGMRQLPGNGGVMDLVLRNCVRGGQQEALAPLLADSIEVAPVARDPQGSSRMLSPLAAPSTGIAVPSSMLE